MSGSIFGKHFTIQTFGESHGEGIGVVVDGAPAGLPLSSEDIQVYLNRRKPGNSKYATKRAESDTVEILSGIFEGKTTGTPIALLVRNTSQRSGDYSEIASYYRPGHADYTFDAKYGFRDYRGGGRTSGRETIGRVAAGAIASKLLDQLGIRVTAYTKSIGTITVPETSYDHGCIQNNPLYMPNLEYARKASAYLEECVKNKDSCGGIIECVVTGMPAGIGEPVFEKLDASLAKAIMSVGAVKGVEIGGGFQTAQMQGSTNNDAFCRDDDRIMKRTNHSGGTLGGLSDGSPIILRAAVKPTPSISQEQDTVDIHGDPVKIAITGRHDPVIVPRAVVVVEAMTAVTVADLLMRNMTARMEYLEKIYNK